MGWIERLWRGGKETLARSCLASGLIYHDGAPTVVGYGAAQWKKREKRRILGRSSGEGVRRHVQPLETSASQTVEAPSLQPPGHIGLVGG